MATIGRRATFVGALWNTASMVFPLLSTVLLSAVIARRLGTPDLGEQSLISYVGNLVGYLVVISANNCSTQVMASAYGAGEFGRLARLSRLSDRVHLAGGLVAGVIVGSIGAFRHHPLSWVLLGVVTLVDAWGWGHAARLIARHGWRAVAQLRLGSQIASSLVGVGGVFAGGGIEGVFAAQVVTSTCLALVLRRRDLAERPEALADVPRIPLAPLARLWGLFALSVGLAQVVAGRVELLFLDAFRTPSEVATYAVAFSLTTVGVTIPTALALAVVPGIAAAATSDSVANLPTHVLRASRVAVLASSLLSTGLAAVGPLAVVVFWGPGLHSAARIVPFAAMSILFVPVAAVLKSYWTGVGSLTPVLAANGLGAAADVGAAVALVPHFGVAGAVTANILAQVVSCACIVVYTRRRGLGVGATPPLLLRCACIAAACGVAARLAGAAVAGLGAIVGLLAGCGVFALVLGLVGLTVGLVPREDADWLSATLPRQAGSVLGLVGGKAWARARSTAPEIGNSM